MKQNRKWGSWAKRVGNVPRCYGVNQSIYHAFANKQIRWWIIMEHIVLRVWAQIYMPLIVFILFLNQTHTQTHGVMDTVIIVEISLSTNRRKKTQPKKGKGSPNLPYQNWVAYAPLTIDRRIMAGSTSGRCVRFLQRCAVTSVSMKRSPSKRGANLLPPPPRGFSLDADPWGRTTTATVSRSIAS